MKWVAILALAAFGLGMFMGAALTLGYDVSIKWPWEIRLLMPIQGGCLLALALISAQKLQERLSK
jgi:hypothetical protein